MGAQVKMTDDMGRGIGTAAHAVETTRKEIIINGNGGRGRQDERLVQVADHYKEDEAGGDGRRVRK